MRNFIKLDLDLFKDKQLNLYERVVLSYIGSYPDGYFSTVTYLADTLDMARETVQRMLKKLVNNGYLDKKTDDEKTVYTVIKNHTVIENHTVTKNHTKCDLKSQGCDLKSHKEYNIRNNKKYISKTVSEKNTKKTQKNDFEKPSLIEVLNFFVDNNLHGSGTAFFEHYAKYNFKYQGKPIDWQAKAKEWSSTEKTKTSYSKSLFELKALKSEITGEQLNENH